MFNITLQDFNSKFVEALCDIIFPLLNELKLYLNYALASTFTIFLLRKLYAICFCIWIV